jgi:hypothetical protein
MWMQDVDGGHGCFRELNHEFVRVTRMHRERIAGEK